jgi:hypothetical protein
MIDDFLKNILPPFSGRLEAMSEPEEVPLGDLCVVYGK